MALTPTLPKHEAAPSDKGGQEGAHVYSVDPNFVAECFNVLVSCTHISGAQVVAAQGKEQFATAFAMYFAYTFHRLSVMDPASTVIRDLHKRYKRIFSPTANFGDTPFHHTLFTVDTVVTKRWNPNQAWKNALRAPNHEYVLLTWHMVSAAQVGYQRTRHKKVPRWILRFALDSLSLNPQPPTFVVATCLTILAIDMGCDVAVISKRCVYSSVTGICPSDRGPVRQSSMPRISLSRNLQLWLKLGTGIQ